MLKGQSSIEYFAVVAIGLVIAAPFVLSVQDSLTNVISGSETAELESSLDGMEEAVGKADALGESSKTSFTLELPSTVEEASFSENGEVVVYTVDEPGGLTNYTRIFDTQVSGDLPDEPGFYMGSAEAGSEEVEISFENYDPE